MSFKHIDNPFYRKKEDYYRVYLRNIFEFDEEVIQKYKRETLTKTYIYSDLNILEITKNNEIVKIEYIDVPIYSKSFAEKNISLLIDKSKEKRGEIVFQIPLNHEKICTEIDIYSINPKSNLKFNVVKIKDEIVDFYFTTNEDLEHVFIKEELFTFVPLLK